MTRAETVSDRAEALRFFSVSRETEILLAQYAGWLQQWQSVKNLVGPKTLEHVWTRHFADSAQILKYADSAGIWLDLGSGAGFPGLVIAILLRHQEGTRVHLVESNARKCAFLRHVIRETQAPAEVHEKRIEAAIPDFIGKIDVVTARALAPLTQLLALTAPLLAQGAIGFFPKGQDALCELTEARESWKFEAALFPSAIAASSTLTSTLIKVSHVERL